VCVGVCLCVFMHTSVRANVLTCAWVGACLHVYVCMYASMHVLIIRRPEDMLGLVITRRQDACSRVNRRA
jgi:hypothetical protein